MDRHKAYPNRTTKLRKSKALNQKKEHVVGLEATIASWRQSPTNGSPMGMFSCEDNNGCIVCRDFKKIARPTETRSVFYHQGSTSEAMSLIKCSFLQIFEF
jgi:hypothetical protein